MVGCYLPLLCWGPLLVVVVRDYHRRHSGRPSPDQPRSTAAERRPWPATTE